MFLFIKVAFNLNILTLFDVLSILSGLDSASLNMENRWVCLDVCLCVS